MKTKLVVGVALLVAVTCSVWMAWAAPGDLTIATGPVMILKSDLVIQKVCIAGIGGGDFPTGTIEVTVKNRGAHKSPACTVGGICTTNIDALTPPGTMTQAAPLKSLDPDETEVVTLSYLNVGNPWRGMLIVVADVPVAGKPEGQATETIEYNNSFVSSFDTTGVALPHYLKGKA